MDQILVFDPLLKCFLLITHDKLRKTMVNNLGDAFRVVKPSVEGIECIIPVYFWLEHHHTGQWSWEYEAFCRLGNTFSPGCGGLDSNDELTKLAYNDLCDEHECDHERLTTDDY